MAVLLCRSRARKTTCLLPAPSGIAERRRSYRHPCCWNCSCRPISLKRGGPGVEVLVRDISADGIGLVVNGYIVIGTFLSVLLPSATGRERPLRAQVVRAQRTGKRTWIVGCVLNPRLDADELQAML